ncbi:MAG: adenylate/guanylate cyclase domain-containing protein [Methylacidiphilales bacterium]|nr:adenylate/guanylate cyclase domain-containing protein [Candidatus Methylacidiphilales bacterium]
MASTFKEHQTLSGRILSYLVWAPLILTGFFFLMEHYGLLERLENLTIDQRIVERAQNQAPPDSRLFFVGIDDTSYVDLGRFPWDRKVHAEFTQVVGLGNPAVFIWDILFDRNTAEESDGAFAESIRNAGIPVITGASSGTEANKEFQVPAEFENNWPVPAEIQRSQLRWRDYMILPAPFLRNITIPGLVDADAGRDGVIRKIPLVAIANKQVVPTLGLAGLMAYWKIKPSEVRMVPGDAIYLESNIVKRRIPIDAKGFYTVNYRYDVPSFGPSRQLGYSRLAGAYYQRSTTSISSPNLPDVQGKILLIGLNATASTEIGPSPFSGASPRPFVHMNVMDNILKEDYLRFTPTAATWLGTLALGWLSLLAFSRIGFWFSAILPPVFIAAYIALAFYLLGTQNLVLDITGPCLAFLFLHIGSVAKQVLVERAAREHLRRTFSTYVSPAILETIYRNPESLQLGGASKDVTILFTDLRNFTTMTESMDSATLVRQLNEYFTEMVACITRHNGTLHKYIGDAIMAVWGDVTNEGAVIEAGQALRAAIEMREAMRTLNQRWRSEGRPEFHMGIGINHGHVIVGNIGAPQRMEFTVIGDAVNLASRLEGVNKQFGTDILIGQSVHELTHERFLFRSLAKIQVVGKSIPVEIYEPMCEIGSEQHSPYSNEWLQLYQEAQQRFQERRYDVAARLFEACLHEYPENKICVILLNLCHQFAANPPPEDWDGSLELSSK